MAEWTNRDASWACAALRTLLLRCVRSLVAEQERLAAEHQRVALQLRKWLT